jgi:hypothetical protein
MVSGASRTDVDDALDKFTATVLKQLREDSYYSKVVPDDVMEKLARVAISRVFAASFSGRGVTGIVFAGYGEKEYFPKVEKYICHGLILGKPYFSKEDEICISHSNASDAMPLAQADMINTFISGASFKSMSDIHGIMLKQLEEIEKKLKADGHLNKDFSFDDIRATVEDSFRAQVVEYFYNTHRKPLQRVIASLPIDELAELAETLVYIESLKERVTSPSESVSGPIDVAVISKHDGFIWIKRKHYFKGELNPRFFVNRQRET